MAYGAGLRISEVANLKVRDNNLEELTIHLKNVKGRLRRESLFFQKKIKTELQNLIAGKNLNDYLFENEQVPLENNFSNHTNNYFLFETFAMRVF